MKIKFSAIFNARRMHFYLLFKLKFIIHINKKIRSPCAEKNYKFEKHLGGCRQNGLKQKRKIKQK